jgi:branched-chain amino acid transport system ATP-binding protein
VNPVLELESFSTGYGRRAVVRDVSLKVHSGEVVALLGANGAGKTTTLLGISGLLPTFEGTVKVGGEVTSRSRHPHRLVRRGLAHIPQDRALFPKLTVDQHLKLAYGYTPAGAQKMYDLFPQLVKLSQRRAGLLSGGEQQMVAMARGLIASPSVLIVDEMSQGLAPMVVEQLLLTVRRLATENGVGVLLVEQHVDKALALADRALVLTHGRVTLSGTAAELRSNQHRLEVSYLGRDDEEGEIRGTHHRSRHVDHLSGRSRTGAT